MQKPCRTSDQVYSYEGSGEYGKKINVLAGSWRLKAPSVLRRVMLMHTKPDRDSIARMQKRESKAFASYKSIHESARDLAEIYREDHKILTRILSTSNEDILKSLESSVTVFADYPPSLPNDIRKTYDIHRFVHHLCEYYIIGCGLDLDHGFPPVNFDSPSGRSVSVNVDLFVQDAIKLAGWEFSIEARARQLAVFADTLPTVSDVWIPRIPVHDWEVREALDNEQQSKRTAASAFKRSIHSQPPTLPCVGGRRFIMSIEPKFLTESDDTAPPEAIALRIERGSQTGRMHKGAIVPFPESVKPSHVFNILTGKARARVDDLRAHGYKPTAFAYHSATGEIIQMVLRFEHDTERKEIRPLRFLGEFPDKGRVYDLSAIDGIKPLYNLHLLAQRPNASILVVEGEKTAEAAATLFPDHVVTTWMSGAYNVRNAEMLAMAGRDVTLWPDNDPPGRKAMRLFAARAYEAGAASVKFVDVPKEFGEGWDLADSIPAELANDHSVIDMVASARPIDPAEVAPLLKDRKAKAEQRRLLGHPIGYSNVDKDAADAALSVLDPGMYGNQWRRVARCIFYAFGDDGLPLFDSWSQGSTEKYRDGEPAKLWDEYRNEPHFRGESIAWLFKEAAIKLAQRGEDDADTPNVELDKKAMMIAAIEELNENHAIVVRGGKTAVLREHYDPRYERYVETYFSKKDFTEQFVRPIALAAGEDDEKPKPGKSKKQGELWFSSVSRRQFESVYFAPSKTLLKSELNLWRGFTVEAKDDPAGWSRFKKHILENIAGGDQAAYAYILNWMAFAVQRLGKPLGVALVLIGLKGSGKSILVQLFGHLFGQHTFVTSRMEDVVGRFNDRLETTLLLGLEEAVAPQNKAADGTLKDLITRKDLRLEGKFFSVWDAPNHLRIIVTSNNERVVRADASERRYAVFEVINPHQHNPHERRRYFGQMVEQMETGGYEAMLGELLTRDISSFNPEISPDTDALRRQKLLNLSNDPVRYYLYERLSEGIGIVLKGADGNSELPLWHETETVWVGTANLAADFQAFCEAEGIRYNVRSLQLQLPRYMPDGFKSQVRRAKHGDTITGNFRAYPFPPLEQARAIFEEKTGLKIDRDPVEVENLDRD